MQNMRLSSLGRLFSLIVALVLSACATTAVGPEPDATISENSAAMALYQQAQTLLDQGETEQAKAKIERALRIESDNPYLWFQLAHIGYIEQDYSLASEMAKRAKSFAGGNTSLQRDIDKFLRQLTKSDNQPLGY